MTITFVTPANSSVNALGDGKVIGLGDTLYVLSGAYLGSSMISRYGALATGTSTAVTSIIADGAIWGDEAGIALSNAGTGQQVVTVGSTGTISSNGHAISLSGFLNAGNFTIQNAGSIALDGTSGGSFFFDGVKVHSVILGINVESFALTNSGVISNPSGQEAIFLKGNPTGDAPYVSINNTGEIDGNIELTGNDHVAVGLINTGRIIGNFDANNVNGFFENHGTILGNVAIFDSTLLETRFDNSGGHLSNLTMTVVNAPSSVDLTNAVIDRSVFLDGQASFSFLRFGGAQIGWDLTIAHSASPIDLTGVKVGGNVSLQEGPMTVTFNAGSIHGNLSSFEFADSINMVGGQVLGVIDLGSGDDSLVSGDSADIVQDEAGNDSYDLGGGNDVFRVSLEISGTNSNDSVDGGAGVDTLDLSGIRAPGNNNSSYTDATGGVFVSLEEGLMHGSTTNTANLFGTDEILNFENVIGGDFNDQITGDAGVNRIGGGAGNDRLTGMAGNDILKGGAGADVIEGDSGRDLLTGGAGADTFLFLLASDSGTLRANRDVIRDFTQGSDKINLAAIDASTSAVGVQHFTFAGPNIKSGEGTVRYVFDHGDTLIQANTGGTNSAEFSILLNGTHLLTASDFIFA